MTHSLRFVAAFALLAVAAHAESPVNTDADGLALEGHDPVAFFTIGVALPGKPGITAEHNGATYRFAKQAHRDSFVANPEKFLPAYGGYCAYGAAKGALYPVAIETWQIIDGRLILNYNAEIKEQFDANVEDFLAAADANWPGLNTAVN